MPIYSRWIGQQPLHALVLGFVLVLALTAVGAGFGIPQLFWHDDAFPLFMSGFSIASLAILLWSFSCLVKADEWLTTAAATLDLRRPIPWKWDALPTCQQIQTARALRLVIRAMFLPLGAILLIASVVWQIAEPEGMWLLLPLGATAAWVIAEVAIGSSGRAWGRHGSRMPEWVRGAVVRRMRTLLSLIALFAVAGIHIAARLGLVGHWLSAVTVLCIVLAELSILTYLTQDYPLVRVALLVIVVPLVAYNNSEKYKLTFPGFGEYYPTARGRAPIPMSIGSSSKARHDRADGGLATPPLSPGSEYLPMEVMLAASATSETRAKAIQEKEEASLRSRADPRDREASARVAYWEARVKLFESDLDGVVSALGKAYDRFPEDPSFRDSLAEAYYLRAMANKRIHRRDRAIVDLGAALSLRPDDASIRLDRARLSFEMADLDSAALDLRTAIGQDGRHGETASPAGRAEPFSPSDLSEASLKKELRKVLRGAPVTPRGSGPARPTGPPAGPEPIQSQQLLQMKKALKDKGPLPITNLDPLLELQRYTDRRYRSNGLSIAEAQAEMAVSFGIEKLKSRNFAEAIDFLELAEKSLNDAERFLARDRPDRPGGIMALVYDSHRANVARLRARSRSGLELANLLSRRPATLVDDLARLTRERPEDPLPWLAIAMVRLQNGGLEELKKARDHFTTANDLDQNDHTALEGRAICFSRLGDEVAAGEDRRNAALRRARSLARARAEARESDDFVPPRYSAWASVLTGPVDDLSVLNRWLDARRDEELEKPILVVIATSGGGISAAVWTLACLSRLERGDPAFPRHVRVIFGASGGMVGAGTYVTSLKEPGTDPDREQTLTELAHGVSADSLTPTMVRLLLGDLPSALDWRPQDEDRGRTLESAWQDHTHLTGVKIADLAEGERSGWRPSLVVSPMILEGSKRLLISNLKLEGLAESDEVFELYPGSWAELQLGTALRMNASFALVSPGVYLPEIPPGSDRRATVGRRVVDAGYLDNYGVSLACAWIEKHRGWLLANTSGVRLVQVVAYPKPEQETNDGFGMHVRRGFESILTPSDGLGQVRQNSMIDAASRSVSDLRHWFNDGASAGEPFFGFETLDCRFPAALSWRLSAADRRRIQRSLEDPSFQGAIERILAWLRPRTPR